MNLLVSIILPVYNGADFIKEAINSVIQQTYSNWELIIVNDGSTDRTDDEINIFSDKRIVYIYQDNKGVSSARNKGLKIMKGEYFCFLDADDKLTEKSIEARVDKFISNSNIIFVDGIVEFYNESFDKQVKLYKPSFIGNPYSKLIKLSDEVFMGISWMIKNKSNIEYSFYEDVKHGEDLLFYISISKEGLYDYVNEPIMQVRNRSNSAMSDTDGLADGYEAIYKKMRLSLNINEQKYLRNKIISIMLKTYVKNMNILKAIKYYFKLMRI